MLAANVSALTYGVNARVYHLRGRRQWRRRGSVPHIASAIGMWDNNTGDMGARGYARAL